MAASGLNVRRGWRAAGVVGLLLVLVGWFSWRGQPPQLGADREVFRTVDALFTAITARDERLLRDCAGRLRTHHADGKMPGEAWAYLGDVVATAEAGRWQPAAENLYAFMKAQRREGRP